ncbi:hypothetical protein MES4922_120174 [Mesorhizobium ventifaucium]|uniref:ATP-dependent DNA ligase family profile domain-containing protein n=1 Tax=Mesorhizobium ventifaucium TaxID=666020 RepID=A0ABM9DFW2_9HYPH|nr:hypothetical protein MES4922_120174 [Mesorhizobium ventifaucium]
MGSRHDRRSRPGAAAGDHCLEEEGQEGSGQGEGQGRATIQQRDQHHGCAAQEHRLGGRKAQIGAWEQGAQGSTMKVFRDGGFTLPLDTPPMEAKAADAIPEGDGWQYERKWDGFRCLAFRQDDAVELRAKSGKPLGRYFPELVETLKELPSRRFVVDHLGRWQVFVRRAPNAASSRREQDPQVVRRNPGAHRPVRHALRRARNRLVGPDPEKTASDP